jgi:hypothetical protein
MTAHKFAVGQVVEARASKYSLSPPGAYEVMRLLPPTGTSNQYRLRSLKNGNEWVVREEDIRRDED